MSNKTGKAATTSQTSKTGSGGSLGNTVGLIVVVAICAVAAWGVFGQKGPESTDRPIPAKRTPRQVPDATSASAPPAAAVSQGPPNRPGEPWEYDPKSDNYFDPRPGHEHWHQGPPPPPDQRVLQTSAPTLTPVATPPGADPNQGRPTRQGTPWEYDAESGFHWDPRAGHQHWHPGEPPPEDQRQ